MPAIARAIDMGLEVIVLDRNPNAPGMKLPHHAIPVDFMNQEESLKVASMMKIDGVLTISSDLPVATMGCICDALSLPGITEAVGRRCSNKLAMKKCLKRHCVPTADFLEIRDEEEAHIMTHGMDYPVMVKAVDSSGSRGVTRVDRSEGMKEAYRHARNHSRCGRVIVEPFIEGLEFGAQAFVEDGDLRMLVPHNDTLSTPPYYIPAGHSLPFHAGGCEAEQIREIAARAIEALEIRHGAVNLDFIYTPEGPMVLEVGARFGGTCLPALVSIFTGIDLVEAVIRLALGEAVDFSSVQHQPVAALLITSPMDGRLRKIEMDPSIRNIRGVVEVSIEAQPGDWVHRFVSGPDRIGHIIATGENDLDAEERVRSVRSLIRLDIG